MNETKRAALDRKNAAARLKRAGGLTSSSFATVNIPVVPAPKPKTVADLMAEQQAATLQSQQATANLFDALKTPPPAKAFARPDLGTPPAAPTAAPPVKSNAGRKPLNGQEAMHTVSFKCTNAQHAEWSRIVGGGAAWVRWGLDERIRLGGAQ